VAQRHAKASPITNSQIVQCARSVQILLTCSGLISYQPETPHLQLPISTTSRRHNTVHPLTQCRHKTILQQQTYTPKPRKLPSTSAHNFPKSFTTPPSPSSAVQGSAYCNMVCNLHPPRRSSYSTTRSHTSQSQLVCSSTSLLAYTSTQATRTRGNVLYQLSPS